MPDPIDLEEAPLTSEEIYDGALLHVFRDEARLPDGNTGVREWIKHPGASAVVPLFEDGSTLLLRQFRYPPRQTFIEVPAGKLDKPGEHPEEVARRELVEETGYRGTRFTYLGPFYPCIGYSDEVIHLYLAEGLSQDREELALEAHEFVDPFRVPFSEALQMVWRGEVQDMKTVTALVMAWNFIEERTKKGTS